MVRLSTCFLLLAASTSASSMTWTLTGHEVFASGEDVTLRLTGHSTSGCIPSTGRTTINGSSIRIRLDPIPPTSACTLAPTSWDYTTEAFALPVAGEYQVTVLQDATTIGSFARGIHPSAPGAIAKRDLLPAQGMWWSSEQPGTGLAFNIDREGRWFGALYLYDTQGEPTFLTLQGDSLAFNIADAGNLAVATSPLIHSEGGQCLLCPWTQSTTSDTGDDARLTFHTRTHATLSVQGWELQLAPLPEPLPGTQPEPVASAAPIPDTHYVLTVDGPDMQHMAVVAGVARPVQDADRTGRGLVCVDCRTVDQDGQATDGVDAALNALVEDIRFACGSQGCSVALADDGIVAVSHADVSGEVISAIVPDVDSPTSPVTHIQLRQLPPGWR